MDCWEFTNCGREKDCPAYPRHGRQCFAVTGTWCRGQKQGIYEEKIKRCRELCEFYSELMGGEPWDKTGTD